MVSKFYVLMMCFVTYPCFIGIDGFVTWQSGSGLLGLYLAVGLSSTRLRNLMS